MDNISDISYETIRRLILESTWGKSVTNNELFNFLFNEIYEFVDGCNSGNKDNMLEEAADVLMMLLYIVIKNVDNQHENQIDELLFRLNKKLQTRYSVFFEGNKDSESEELHWVKTKYIEKEILNYLYCPISYCKDFAKINRGNMIFDGNHVKCLNCGYTKKCSSNNMILYTSKYRRKLFNALDNSYVGYIKGTLFYADSYFNDNRQDYLKVMRYYIGNKIGSLALKDYFISKHNSPENSFDEFLMHPLRNFLLNFCNNPQKFSRANIEINDLMLKCINVNYIEIKNKFCNNNPSYSDIWMQYIRYLTKSMILSVKYDLDVQSLPTWLPKQNDSQIPPVNSYNLFVVLEQEKKAEVYIKHFSVNDRENGVEIVANMENCRQNIHIGQVLISIIIKFNLQHMPKLNCTLINIRKNLNCQNLWDFLKDLLPLFNTITYK